MPRGSLDALRQQTFLPDEEERKYQQWVKHYNVKDVDPKTGETYDDVFYDMRGYWKANEGPPGMIGYGPPQFEGAHGPDTFKQRGHPTFSQESQYSRGPWEGGKWLDDGGSGIYLAQPPMAVSHKQR